MVSLLPHNLETYEKVQKAIADDKKKIAVSHATGTGKSYLVVKLFEDYSNESKLVLVPSTYISEQIKKLFEKYDIQNVDIMLYQKLIKMSDEDIAAMDYDVVALDEYHHDTSKVWGEKVRKLIDTHPESIIFGTSATPVRSDGVNTIDELFEGNCASDLSLSESIAKKIVPLPKYVGALYKLDDELERLRKKVEQATNTKEEKQEFYKKIDSMRSQIEKSYGMPIILNKHIKNKNGKYIVFCKKKKHLREIKDTVIGWFKTAGFKNINAYEVYSDYENKDAEYKAFYEDTSHNLKLLFCVNMLNEGLHLENISGVLLLRPTKSSIVWHQQIGRAIEANNTNTPVIIDAVNNFSAIGQGMELMQEIKDAVVKEKENDPDYDDSRFEDIDTFFVLEQIVEIQEMFKEIEGRLRGSWDLYIKALKQYKEREGDCLVPDNYVEVVDGRKISLGRWVQNMRAAKKGKGRSLLTEKGIKQLEELNFIWDYRKYTFRNTVQKCIRFYKENGRLPHSNSQNEVENNLGVFIANTKRKVNSLPQWKIDLLECIPTFFDKINLTMFDIFYKYAIAYREIYGHTNIKINDVIEGYNIGIVQNELRKKYRKGKLSNLEIDKLEKLGILLGYKRDELLKKYMELAKQAVNEGIIIDATHREYKGKNLYTFILNNRNNLSAENLDIINKLKPEQQKKPVEIIDSLTNDVYLYSSIAEAGRALCNEFKVVDDSRKGISIIHGRISGKTKNPIYKGRFRFEYVEDSIG